MQIDYLFLKRAVNSIKDAQSHYIDLDIVADELQSYHKDMDNNAFMDKFIGHMRLLKDNGVIEEVIGRNLGVEYHLGGINIKDCYVRLTSTGYDFCDMLNKKGAIEKLKNISVSGAVYICKTLCEKAIEKVIDLI